MNYANNNSQYCNVHYQDSIGCLRVWCRLGARSCMLKGLFTTQLEWEHAWRRYVESQDASVPVPLTEMRCGSFMGCSGLQVEGVPQDEEDMPVHEDVPPHEDMALHKDMPPHKDMALQKDMPMHEDMPPHEDMALHKDMPMHEDMPPNEDMPIHEDVPPHEDMPTHEDMLPHEDMAPHEDTPPHEGMPPQEAVLERNQYASSPFE
jgi:hypothetical protein